MTTAQQTMLPKDALERRDDDAARINDYAERVVIAYMMEQPDSRITREDIPKITATGGHPLFTDRDVKNAIERLGRPAKGRSSLIAERTTQGGASYNGWEFKELGEAQGFLD